MNDHDDDHSNQPGLAIFAGTSMLPREKPRSGQYYDAGQRGSVLSCAVSDQELRSMRKQNNPSDLAVGHGTGRCAYCGSNNLWDDNLAYGCNACGTQLGGN